MSKTKINKELKKITEKGLLNPSSLKEQINKHYCNYDSIYYNMHIEELWHSEINSIYGIDKYVCELIYKDRVAGKIPLYKEIKKQIGDIFSFEEEKSLCYLQYKELKKYDINHIVDVVKNIYPMLDINLNSDERYWNYTNIDTDDFKTVFLKDEKTTYERNVVCVTKNIGECISLTDALYKDFIKQNKNNKNFILDNEDLCKEKIFNLLPKILNNDCYNMQVDIFSEEIYSIHGKYYRDGYCDEFEEQIKLYIDYD